MTHWTLDDDPHAAREAEKYDNPVPSREYLLARLEEYGKPITHENMSAMLGLEDDNQLEAVRRRLAAMERDGQILRDRKGAYALIDKLDLIKGRVQGHRDGMGFLIRHDGRKPDLVLPPRQMRRVFDGDMVLARVSGRDRRGRDEATIVEVLARNTQTLVGVFRQNSPEFAVLIPENSRISQEVIIPHSASQGAKDGQIVSVNITRQPETRQQPVGEVVEVLGERMDPGLEIDIAIRTHDIPAEFPPEVDQQIAGIRRGPGGGQARAHRSARYAAGHHRRRGCQGLRRRGVRVEDQVRQLEADRRHRRRFPLCARWQRARQRSLRAWQLGLLPRAGGTDAA